MLHNRHLPLGSMQQVEGLGKTCHSNRSCRNISRRNQVTVYKVLVLLASTLLSSVFLLSRTAAPPFPDKPTVVRDEAQKQEDQENDRPSKLGDGCYHVFLDIGANVGVHGRFVYEPHKYPDMNAKTIEIFTQFFGDPKSRDPRNICVFVFEPNPAHEQRHLDLQKAYGKAGLRYYPIMAGVSDQNGNLTFYHQDGGKHNEFGFSSSKYTNSKNPVTEVTVPVVRLSSWLRDHILGRRIPAERPMLTMIGDTAAPAESTMTTVPMNVTSMPPSVIGKMDVEGMEFIMLPDLLYSGILCQTVDYLFGEFHYWVDFKAEPDKETKRGGYIKTKKDTSFLDTLLEGLHSLRNDDCKLKKFDMHDDEAYIMDGAVLPESVWWEEAHNKK